MQCVVLALNAVFHAGVAVDKTADDIIGIGCNLVREPEGGNCSYGDVETSLYTLSVSLALDALSLTHAKALAA